MAGNNFPIWICEIFPFALSLSKGERKNFWPTASSRSCFDRLSTNGLTAENSDFGKLFLTKSLTILGLRFISFDLQHADKAAELWQITSPLGLSLGDRACLATGLIEKMPVMTADQIWQKIPLPLDVSLIR
ncbi:MAG: hypothetical protein WAW41_03655 [Methylobacter sp.]